MLRENVYYLTEDERFQASRALRGLEHLFEDWAADHGRGMNEEEVMWTKRIKWLVNPAGHRLTIEEMVTVFDALEELESLLDRQADQSFWVRAIKSVPHDPRNLEDLAKGMAELRSIQCHLVTKLIMDLGSYKNEIEEDDDV